MEKERLFLLDFIRGSLMMVIIFYHYIFNLSYFLNYNIDLDSFSLRLIPPLTSSLFLLISGYSASLSRNSLKRGLFILFWASIISLVTFFVTPQGPIYFGILHSIGSMMLLGFFLRKMPDKIILFLGLLFFAAGFYVKNISLSHNYLLFLGLVSANFASLDYYPLFPSGSFFLFGIYLSRKKRPDFLSFKIENKIGGALSFAGKNSLTFYLLHQPLFFIIHFFLITLL